MVATPVIIQRETWGARPVQTPAAWIGTPQPELWLHHTASRGLHGAAGMRSLQANAIAGGYVDLEYTVVCDNPTPTIYMSRGFGRDTAATGGHNARSHAICVMGNFEGPDGDEPSAALIEQLAQLVAWGWTQGYWPNQITGPHKNASGNSTACCGSKLIARISAINVRVLQILAGVAPTPAPTPPPVTGGAVVIVTTPSGKGYYIVAADGGVFCHGDAKYFGSLGATNLNAPIVGMAVRPQSDGYWLVGEDGGVFTFGHAVYKGGMVGKPHAPIVDIACDAEGDGYWLLARDGGVFTFGDTAFYGSDVGKIKV